jgi:hypothetical protein
MYFCDFDQKPNFYQQFDFPDNPMLMISIAIAFCIDSCAEGSNICEVFCSKLLEIDERGVIARNESKDDDNPQKFSMRVLPTILRGYLSRSNSCNTI